MRCWDSLVAWSLGIATWISCGMSCRPLCLLQTDSLLLSDGTCCSTGDVLFVWGSGEEPHHFCVPPGWDVHPRGKSQMPGLLVYQGVCKFKWRSFETELHKALLKAWRQHPDLAWTGLKEWRKGAEGEGHLEMSKRLGSSLEIQICMCKNLYWARFTVACICHFCQIASREWQ